MVDLNTCPPTPPAGESSKIKNFMGRTPGIGILKSKFLSVLGNSNELLNGISNKLTLSISSSESEYCDDDDEELPHFDESIDYTKIDFESRRVKARRAHEEIISGRYRHPNLAPRPRFLTSGSPRRVKSADRSGSSSSSTSSPSSRSVAAGVGCDRSSTTRSNSIESRHSGGYGRPGRAVAGARRSDVDMLKDLRQANVADIHSVIAATHPQIDVQPPTERDRDRSDSASASASGPGVSRQTLLETATVAATTSVNSIRVPPLSKNSNSSTLTSLRDDPDALQVSPSVESTDWRHFIRSESQNSVPSWASSISLDCRTGEEEPIKEFMKHFTEVVFTSPAAIGLELKSEFGTIARLESGRQWFTRFLLEQKAKSKHVNELTFFYLVQFLAIVLFECAEGEDFTPASTIMNLCFTFYHEIDVPGCDPYREYLFIFMRQQPIWHTLRFWNAAFFDAVQSEREHRLAMKAKSTERRRLRKARALDLEEHAKERPGDGDQQESEARVAAESGAESAASASSSSSSSHHSDAVVKSESAPVAEEQSIPGFSEAKLQENIVFRQLGTFTCNMHALGIRQELCLEFLKRQTSTWNLAKDKMKIVKDNINRMYHETDLWGAKES